MNQNQIQQLTSHLSQALDQNYDVVNMDAVLSVICALEGTTITKEQLEATRLAKYINHLRRRTKNEHLARRAKSLLKKWREMVGIHQTTSDFNHQHSQITSQPIQPTIDFIKSTSVTTEGQLAETNVRQPISTSLPGHRIISDVNSNVDSHELRPLPVHSHTNFSNVIHNINDCDRDESNSINSAHNHKDQRISQHILSRHVGSPQSHIIEKSINSVSSLSDIGIDKINEVSVVIDIVSDSDENDNNSAPMQRSKIDVPASLVISSASSPRPKKLKRDKKCKDRGQLGQSLRCGKNVKGVFLPTTLPADSEIFSLSNSSMSSILSGDATLGNAQSKSRSNDSELTFTGRFRSVTQSDVLNQNSLYHLASQKNTTRINEIDKSLLEDYVAYESSASCSRFSPLTQDHRKLENVNDSTRSKNTNAVQIPMPSIALGHDLNSRTDFLEHASQSYFPKKRGRKKGSKGVDAVIAKESSSLSHQIFFGGSAVKKVKTTKELFNEIQSRKLGVPMQSSTSNLLNSSTIRDVATRASLPRPMSSCSELQLNQTISLYLILKILKLYIADVVNTDSDTATSYPSPDSNKSQELKECTSLDSNSTSMQTLSCVKKSGNMKFDNLNNITTQLMHLIHSLNTPLSIFDIEKIYRSQIVPCTCIVIESVSHSVEATKSSLDIDKKVPIGNTSNGEKMVQFNEEEKLTMIERSTVNELINTQQKPVKSIFDLDFDDEDDPLHSIMDVIRKPLHKAEESKHKSAIFNVSASLLTNNVSLNLDANADTQFDISNQESNIEIHKAALPVFAVHEDSDCLAKQKFYDQTKKVNNFHINALHNYYIPNVNGNWDNVNTCIGFTSVKDFLHNMDSYTVTNGSDVVPKYNFLTSDRIRKDLSSLKFSKPHKVKPSKSLMSPFLGVAKCLRTCRNARPKTKGRFRDNGEQAEISKSPKYNRSSPLKVDIDAPISCKSSHYEKNMQMLVNVPTENPTPYRSFKDNSIPVFSYNLLKLANDEKISQHTEQSDKNNKEPQDNFSSSTNSCRYSSLKETQNSINKKLLNRRIQTTTVQSQTTRRKRGLKENTMKKHNHDFNEQYAPIKRIKVTFNGDILHHGNNNSSSESEETENDNEYKNSNNGEYAIVQRPIGVDEANSKHIVLTIKKTPSKMNSPVNSTSLVPDITSETEKSVSNSNFSVDNTISSALEKYPLKSKMRIPPSRPFHRLTSKRPDINQTTILDFELNHLFCLKKKSAGSSSNMKLHQKLFFSHELSTENHDGGKERIINYSSSSSSSYDEESNENFASKKGNDAKKKITRFGKNYIKIETDKSAETVLPKNGFESDDSFFSPYSDDDKDSQEVVICTDEENAKCNQLEDFENNGMLISFNAISGQNLSRAITPLESLQNKNCHDYKNKCYNNNIDVLIQSPSANLKLNDNVRTNVSRKPSLTEDLFSEMHYNQNYIKSSESNFKFSYPDFEHRTGIRPISDVNLISFPDVNCTQIEQFKEWHQALQLKSYKNEPLIVLPYVVLE
ncbi:hypothetical protein KR009_007708 [Drosophila setifemur]|nr:hypothetical protein KR009_007708 [Drosophila setifemur]